MAAIAPEESKSAEASEARVKRIAAVVRGVVRDELVDEGDCRGSREGVVPIYNLAISNPRRCPDRPSRRPLHCQDANITRRQ